MPEPFVSGRKPQPKMQADAAMHPDDDKKHRLLRHGRRPDPRKLIGVARVDAEDSGNDPRADDMREQEERYGEAERDLRQLPRRHAPASQPGNPHDREPQMDEER